MHFIVTAIGSAGDINPMVVIGSALVKRGHQVDFVANGYFKARVEAAGLNFVELGSEQLYYDSLLDPDLWKPQKGFAAVWKTLRAAMPEEYKAVLKRTVPGNTKLIGSTLALGTRMVCEKFDVPMATVHLSPACLLSAYDMPALPALPDISKLPLFLRELFMQSCDFVLLDPVCQDDINRFRSTIDLPPVKQIFGEWLHAPDRVIGAFPDWFAAVQPDWPPNSVTTGFPLNKSNAGDKLPVEMEHFLSDGNPPIVFTAGTAMQNSRRFFQTALECVAYLESRAIFLCQFPEQLPPELPGNVIVAPYVALDLALPRTAAIVHHGGIGTSAQGLAAGVPHLVTPFAHDQFDNAYRLAKLGVGAVSLVHDNSWQWSAKLEQLINNPKVNAAAQNWRHKMSETEAAPLITDLVEQLNRPRQFGAF